MQMAQKEGDQVITSYRDHGHMLACGMDPKGVMAELTGRRGGLSKGKGGSCTCSAARSSSSAATASSARRCRWARAWPSQTSFAATTMYRWPISATAPRNQGQVYETFNMASIWKLPASSSSRTIRYAMGTAANRSTAMAEQLGARGAAFGIPFEQVDGMDVRAVKDAGDRAVEHCRAGEGPYILEMMTYRYRGHSMSDPAKYRSKEEVQKMREEHDPIEQVKARILNGKLATVEDLKKIDADIRQIVTEAAEFAQNDPEPDVSELYTDIYVNA